MAAWPRRECENVSQFLRPLTNRRLNLQVEDFPRGFPKLACFLDSDDAFMVYRRFGSVFSRLLLNKQDEIRTLEAELEAMDKTDRVSGNGNYLMSRTLDVDREHLPDAFNGRSRPQLIEELEKKAMEYGKQYHSSELHGRLALRRRSICSPTLHF